MAVFRPLSMVLWLLFAAGALLLEFFIVLAGATETNPLNQFYWLEADTSKVPGAPSTTRWTNYNYCGVDSRGRNTDCTSNKADFGFQPAQTFGTREGIPQGIWDHHSRFFYLSRFAYPFYLIGLFFTLVTFINCWLMYLHRGFAISGTVMAFVAFFFVLLGSAMSTAWSALAVHEYKAVGVYAHMGAKLMGFTWASTTLMLLVAIMTVIVPCCMSRRQRTTRQSDKAYKESAAGRSSFERVKV